MPPRLPLRAIRALPTLFLRFMQTKASRAHPAPLANYTHFEEGDTVSWKYGSGTAAGTVSEIKSDGTLSIETNGKNVHKHGDEENPAVHVERAGNDVVKRASELTKEAGEGGEHKPGPGRPRKEEHEDDEGKRGPGRPRKAEHEEGEGEHKRGPGRPKKSETEHAEQEGEHKRGRGRPKKTEPEQVEETHKRGRGRPKKAEHAEDTHSKPGPGRPKKLENEDHDSHSTTHKRGPGRPKKDEHEHDDGHTKRGRGRPRKSEHDK